MYYEITPLSRFRNSETNVSERTSFSNEEIPQATVIKFVLIEVTIVYLNSIENVSYTFISNLLHVVIYTDIHWNIQDRQACWCFSAGIIDSHAIFFPQKSTSFSTPIHIHFFFQFQPRNS